MAAAVRQAGRPRWLIVIHEIVSLPASVTEDTQASPVRGGDGGDVFGQNASGRRVKWLFQYDADSCLSLEPISRLPASSFRMGRILCDQIPYLKPPARSFLIELDDGGASTVNSVQLLQTDAFGVETWARSRQVPGADKNVGGAPAPKPV